MTSEGKGQAAPPVEAPSRAAVQIGPLAGADIADFAVAAAAFAASAANAWLVLKGALTPLMGLGLHAAVAIAIAVTIALHHRAGHDLARGLLTLVSTLAAGPVGALGAAVVHLAVPRRAESLPLLAEWYERIANSAEVDPVTRLCDSVAIGRAIDLSAPVPPSFSHVIDQGSLAARQTALGMIARQFHADYLDALAAALRSPEPVVRVQAAAVAARVRGELKASVRAGIAREGGVVGQDALRLASDLDAAARSGLLDQADRLRAEAVARRLRQRGGEALADPAEARAPIAGAGALLANELLRAGRYSEFRRLRRLQAIAATDKLRVRRRPGTAPRGSLAS